ncbi:MAG: VWA domain-containing protein [Planctomycetota bacterium]|nr:VWA domain-containing protein [Planctomycetota bacterium]
MSFQAPWLLALLALVPLAWWWAGRPAARPAVTFSSIDLFIPAGQGWRARLAWLPRASVMLGLAALIVALARPQLGVGQARTTASGVALMAVVDRSSSMQLPMPFEGGTPSRMDVVKRVFTEFVLGNGAELKGRPQDLIGLVTFARFPATACPLTQVHDTIAKLVDNISPSKEQWEGGTAVGDGIALAAARLRRAEEELKARNKGLIDPDFTLRSKAIILLTDGDENVGEMFSEEAAQLCKQWGIKIYAIGVGSEGQFIRTDKGLMRLSPSGSFDEQRMRRLAETTGGAYWRATDGEALRQAYAAIDALEKTEIRSVEYTSYEERYQLPAALGAALLGSGLLLGSTLLRRAP